MAALVELLRGAGASVTKSDSVDSEILAPEITALCVNQKTVEVYLYATDAQRDAAMQTVDPADPSHIGNAIVEWIGKPRFWLGDRVIVLYTGQDPTIEQLLTQVLGPPFAQGLGMGRRPGGAEGACGPH